MGHGAYMTSLDKQLTCKNKQRAKPRSGMPVTSYAFSSAFVQLQNEFDGSVAPYKGGCCFGGNGSWAPANPSGPHQ